MQGGGALEEEEKAGGTREVSYSVDFVCNLPRSPPSVVERYFTQRFYVGSKVQEVKKAKIENASSDAAAAASKTEGMQDEATEKGEGQAEKAEGGAGDEPQAKRSKTAENATDVTPHPKTEERKWTKKDVCFDFQKGVCNREDACKFWHASEEEVRAVVAAEQDEPMLEKKKKKKKNKKKKNPCFAFQKGTCTRGETCKFLHVMEAEMENRLVQCTGEGDDRRDQYIHCHSNNIMLVGLTTLHPALQEGRKITKVEWQGGIGPEQITVSGKKKKGGVWLQPRSVICRVHCDDDTSYVVASGAHGKLVELNKQITEDDVSIVSRDPMNSGFIAILLGKERDTEQVRQRSMNVDDYAALRLGRGEATSEQVDAFKLTCGLNLSNGERVCGD